MKVPGNYDSYLVFNLEQLFHGNLFVLGDPSGSVNASEAAAAAVLVEEDVIKPDLHEGGAGRQHLIMALLTNSPSEEGRREIWFMQQRDTKLLPLRAASLWNTLLEAAVTPHDPNASPASLAACVRVTPLLWVYGALTISCLALHTFPGLCMYVSAQAIVPVPF